MFTTDAAKWAAIDRRDPAADGKFVYAVRTTGVYCRPSCRSRKPNRSNVLFFDDAKTAARAGFRACKRCAGVAPLLPEPVRRACRLIETSNGLPTLAELAKAIGTSAVHLH